MWFSVYFNLDYFQPLGYLSICPLHCSCLQKGVSNGNLVVSAVHPAGYVEL